MLNIITLNRNRFKSGVEANRLKAEFKRITNNKSYSEDNELILELDGKVEQAVKFYR